MPIEVRLQSMDPVRPNDQLLEQIQASQQDLLRFLQEEDKEVSSAQVQPKGGFPTGLEPFAILIIVAFAEGFAEGFAKGAGKGVGEAVGEAAGKKLGARIRRWLEDRFPDTNVIEVSEK
jgi:hypothetical protein